MSFGFSTERFIDSVNTHIRDDKIKEELITLCGEYANKKTAIQKAALIKSLMDILDKKVITKTRKTLMADCHCIGASVLQKAITTKKESKNLDEFLEKYDHTMKREGNVIHVMYSKCYCPSVCKTKKKFSDTYCQCSCGFNKKLFETALNKKVEVTLVNSILQGADQCDIEVRIL
jgi:predicted hydrocarbon binding protein